MHRIIFNWIFLFFILFSSTLIEAQNNMGQVVFEEKVDAHRNMPAEMEMYKDRIPQFRTSNRILYFTPTETYYITKREEANVSRPPSADRRRGRRGFGRRQNQQLYTNLTNKITKEEREFFGKKFLIEGEPRNINWKFTGKQKQVGSFLCQEATYSDSTESIVAWFTPMIPVAAGPGNFANLPGMILHVDINNGERIISAIDVRLSELNEGSIKQPEEGEKVTREEFNALVEAKMKEMESESGGDRGRFWRMRRNNNQN